MVMNLATAQRYAEHLKNWIAPVCARVEIAGSVRRLRPVCNDIDLVCIPKFDAAENDLLGAQTLPPKSFLHAFLLQYIADKKGEAWFRSTAGVPGRREMELAWDAKNILMQLPKCQLDIFVADEATFATRFLIRTGSKEHNIWVAQRAQQLGGRLDPQTGLWIAGERHQPKTEEEFYRLLGVEYIEPQNREAGRLPR